MGDDLDCNNIQNYGERTGLQNYLHDEDKGVREETIFLIFRWNIVLHDSYQADEIVIEIEEWKHKVPGACVKSFSRVLLSVLRHHLKTLYYVNRNFDYGKLLNLEFLV